MLKKYVGLYFNDSWEIVPKKWLLSSNKCYWPTHKNVEELARKNTCPDEKSWSL